MLRLRIPQTADIWALTRVWGRKSYFDSLERHKNSSCTRAISWNCSRVVWNLTLRIWTTWSSQTTLLILTYLAYKASRTSSDSLYSCGRRVSTCSAKGIDNKESASCKWISKLSSELSGLTLWLSLLRERREWPSTWWMWLIQEEVEEGRHSFNSLKC